MIKTLLLTAAVLAASVNASSAKEYPANLPGCFGATIALGFANDAKGYGNGYDLGDPIIDHTVVKRLINTFHTKYGVSFYNIPKDMPDLSHLADIAAVNQYYIDNNCKDFE